MVKKVLRPKGATTPAKGSRLGQVPVWMWAWFTLAGVLVVWDALFVLNRPERFYFSLSYCSLVFIPFPNSPLFCSSPVCLEENWPTSGPVMTTTSRLTSAMEI